MANKTNAYTTERVRKMADAMTITSNEQHVRLKIYEGNLEIGEAAAELIQLSRAQADAEKSRGDRLAGLARKQAARIERLEAIARKIADYGDAWLSVRGELRPTDVPEDDELINIILEAKAALIPEGN